MARSVSRHLIDTAIPPTSFSQHLRKSGPQSSWDLFSKILFPWEWKNDLEFRNYSGIRLWKRNESSDWRSKSNRCGVLIDAFKNQVWGLHVEKILDDKVYILTFCSRDKKRRDWKNEIIRIKVDVITYIFQVTWICHICIYIFSVIYEIYTYRIR